MQSCLIHENRCPKALKCSSTIWWSDLVNLPMKPLRAWWIHSVLWAKGKNHKSWVWLVRWTESASRWSDTSSVHPHQTTQVHLSVRPQHDQATRRGEDYIAFTTEPRASRRQSAMTAQAAAPLAAADFMQRRSKGLTRTTPMTKQAIPVRAQLLCLEFTQSRPPSRQHPTTNWSHRQLTNECFRCLWTKVTT